MNHSHVLRDFSSCDSSDFPVIGLGMHIRWGISSSRNTNEEKLWIIANCNQFRWETKAEMSEKLMDVIKTSSELGLKFLYGYFSII